MKTTVPDTRGVNAEPTDRISADSTARVRGPLGVILLFSSMVSFGLVLLTQLGVVRQRVDADSDLYIRLADDIIRHGSYASTIRGPVYPGLLAAIRFLFGPDHFDLVLHLVQAVLLTVTLWIAHRVFLRVSRDGAIAVWATALCALWVPFYQYVCRTLTEVLTGFLLAAAVYLFLRAIEESRLAYCLATGVAMAAATLTRTVVLPCGFGAAAMIAVAVRPRARGLLSGGVLLLCFCTLVGMWTYRNYRLTGELVPVTSFGGHAFWAGNRPGMYYSDLDTASDRSLGNADCATQEECDRVLFRRALRTMRQRPDLAASIMLRKFSLLWLGGIGNWHFLNYRPLVIRGHIFAYQSIFFVPVFLAALAGWFVMPVEARRRSYPLAALLAVWTVSHVAVYAVPRYALPVQYYEIFYAAIFAKHVYDRRRRRGGAD